VSPGAAVDVDFHVEAGTEDVFAEEILRAGFLDGRAQGNEVEAVDADLHGGGPDRW
jgi:hypothetical protein